MSDVVREILRQVLAETETQQQRVATALQHLQQLREAAPAYPGDPIAEARIEREQQAEVVCFPVKKNDQGANQRLRIYRGWLQ